MKFNKELFYGSEYVSYEGKFVARFKYNKSSKSSFISFLIKNFTTDEYFARLDGGEAPVEILQSKGFVLPHVKRMLVKMGYAPTVTGQEKYLADLTAKHYQQKAA